MDGIIHDSAALPLGISLGTIAAYGVFLAILLRQVSDRASRFVVIAIAVRLIMSALPELSFRPSPLGLSWNAVASVATVGLALLVLRKTAAWAMVIPPFALILLAITLASLVNHLMIDGVEVAIKYAYLMAMALLCYQSFRDHGIDRALLLMTAAFLLPLVLQLETLALGVAKASEADGSRSYIGGYNHEAAFSVILLCPIVLLSLNKRLKPLLNMLAIAAFAFGIILANYRTALIAMVPLIGFAFVSLGLRMFVTNQRRAVLALMPVVLLALVPAISYNFHDRFGVLGEVIDDPAMLTRSPEDLAPDQGRLLSGRVNIWTHYLEGWRTADETRSAFGLGPGAWEQSIGIYAHNTLISTLYELGVFGVCAIAGLWGWMLYLALRSEKSLRASLVAGHLGFIVLNMATMPFWLVEGLLLYAILCGATLYGYLLGARPSTAILPPARLASA